MTSTATSTLPVVLELQDVDVPSMTNPGVTVAEHIDWRVGAGEFWVVAGPQRSGKSDLLMLLAGLMAPAGGTYRLFGGIMPGLAEERLAERLRLGFVFEDGQLFGRMTVAENVALPLRYHREPARETLEQRVQAVLELTELTAARGVVAAVPRSRVARRRLAGRPAADHCGEHLGLATVAHPLTAHRLSDRKATAGVPRPA
jgi:ABC-type transporter Mla maintaining outer membrane lipid asymmetry ATPase subunit MlaF